jgi:hypothetical protein
MLLKYAQIIFELHIILNLLQQVVSDNFYVKNVFYGRVLNSIACVALVRRAADETRITMFSDPSEYFLVRN